MRKLLLSLAVLSAFAVGSFVAFDRSDAPVVSVGLSQAEAQARPTVNLNTSINWTSISGAATYEIMSQNEDGTPFLPAPVDVGNVLTATVGQFLPGFVPSATPVIKQLFVRARNGADIGPWGQLDVDVVTALTAPVLTTS